MRADPLATVMFLIVKLIEFATHCTPGTSLRPAAGHTLHQFRFEIVADGSAWAIGVC